MRLMSAGLALLLAASSGAGELRAAPAPAAEPGAPIRKLAMQPRFTPCGGPAAGAAAVTGPCSGPPGRLITMRLERNLASRPAFLVFRQVVVNGVPATIRVELTGGGARRGSLYRVRAPRQLCLGDGGHWDIQLITADLRSQGIVGGYRILCRSR